MKKISLSLFAVLIILSGCRTTDQATRTLIGSQIGAFAGGIIGAAIGSSSNRWDGTELGATLGSLAGGAAGAAIGAATTPQPSGNIQPYPSSSPNPYAPTLKIEDIYLEDANNNQCIDAGEDCRIVFIIVNNGMQSAQNVEPIITILREGSYLTLSEPVIINEISSEDKISYSVKVKASNRLPNGKAVFSIKLNEENGFGKEAETFNVPTKGR